MQRFVNPATMTSSGSAGFSPPGRPRWLKPAVQIIVTRMKHGTNNLFAEPDTTRLIYTPHVSHTIHTAYISVKKKNCNNQRGVWLPPADQVSAVRDRGVD